jgi:hypothetical protein
MSEGEGDEGFSCIFDIYFSACLSFDIFNFDQSRVNRFYFLFSIDCS